MDMPKKKKGTGALPFKNILAEVMKVRHLTLKEVADLAGVSISVVDSWLSGSIPHDLHSVDRLSQKLGISFRRLLLGVNETVDAPTSLSELYDESDLFDGLCSVQIKRLVPKRKKE